MGLGGPGSGQGQWWGFPDRTCWASPPGGPLPVSGLQTLGWAPFCAPGWGWLVLGVMGILIQPRGAERAACPTACVQGLPLCPGWEDPQVLRGSEGREGCQGAQGGAGGLGHPPGWAPRQKQRQRVQHPGLWAGCCLWSVGQPCLSRPAPPAHKGRGPSWKEARMTLVPWGPAPSPQDRTPATSPWPPAAWSSRKEAWEVRGHGRESSPYLPCLA